MVAAAEDEIWHAIGPLRKASGFDTPDAAEKRHETGARVGPATKRTS